MPFPTYIGSEEMDMLAATFRSHCEAYDVRADAERENVARLIMELFVSGTDDADAIRAALIASRRIH